jgi:hypothetical protein
MHNSFQGFISLKRNHLKRKWNGWVSDFTTVDKGACGSQPSHLSRHDRLGRVRKQRELVGKVPSGAQWADLLGLFHLGNEQSAPQMRKTSPKGY